MVKPLKSSVLTKYISLWRCHRSLTWSYLAISLWRSQTTNCPGCRVRYPALQLPLWELTFETGVRTTFLNSGVGSKAAHTAPCWPVSFSRMLTECLSMVSIFSQLQQLVVTFSQTEMNEFSCLTYLVSKHCNIFYHRDILCHEDVPSGVFLVDYTMETNF